MSHFKSAIALFVGMAILTVISLICCGTALSRNFAYEADIRNNERRLNDLRQAVEQTRTQTAAQSQRYLDEQKRFQTHLADMTSQLQEQTHLREALNQELPPLAGKVKALKEQVATLEQRKNDLDTTLQQAEAAKRELSELSLKITTAKNVEKSLEQSVAALNERLSNASAKQKEATLARDTAEQEQKKISDSLNAVRKEWDDLLKKRDGLLEEIANLKKDAATLKAEQTGRDTLTQSIKDLTAQRDTAQTKLEARKQECEQVNADLSTARANYAQAIKDYNAVKARQGTVEGKIAELETLRAEAETSKARAEEQAEKARVQLGRVNGDVLDAQWKLADLNRQIRKAQETLREVETPAPPQGEAQSGQQQ